MLVERRPQSGTTQHEQRGLDCSLISLLGVSNCCSAVAKRHGMVKQLNHQGNPAIDNARGPEYPPVHALAKGPEQFSPTGLQLKLPNPKSQARRTRINDSSPSGYIRESLRRQHLSSPGKGRNFAAGPSEKKRHLAKALKALSGKGHYIEHFWGLKSELAGGFPETCHLGVTLLVEQWGRIPFPSPLP